jgi:hypothetical protein
MAKALTSVVPSSAVARLLEPGVARAALVEAEPPVRKVVAPTRETPDVKREFILTETTDDALGHRTSLYSKATGTNVTNSHFLRALLTALAHAMPEIEKQAWQIGKLSRPSNARGKKVEREEYERRIAASLLAGMRACLPIE